MLDADRFRARMAAAAVTQAELARRVGISQQTIAKLASGGAYGSRYLHRIARELGTTTAYLEGETDDPDADAPPTPKLDSETRELVDHFGHFSPADRRALLQIARSMAGGAQPSETVHEPGKDYRE